MMVMNSEEKKSNITLIYQIRNIILNQTLVMRRVLQYITLQQQQQNQLRVAHLANELEINSDYIPHQRYHQYFSNCLQTQVDIALMILSLIQPF